MGFVHLHVEIPASLKDLVGAAADEENVTLNEFVTKLIAEKLERPELAHLRRPKPGRPRKPAAAAR